MIIPAGISHALSLDPGIDGTGAAWWDLDVFRRLPSSAASAARALSRLELWSTDVDEPLDLRVIALVDRLEEAISTPGGVWLVLERGTFTGRHAGRGENTRSLGPYQQLIGAMLATIHLLGCSWLPIAPDGLPRPFAKLFRDVKAYRRAGVHQVLAAGGRTREDLPGWGRYQDLRNQDVVDAVWTGLRALNVPISIAPPSIPTTTRAGARK